MNVPTNSNWMAHRDAAIEWARSMLDRDFVVFDTETTGLNADDVVVQVGVVANNGAVLVDSLINPGRSISPEATAIHGITDAMVAGAPRFGDILPRLDEALRGKPVLIYNYNYDTKMLVQTARQENNHFHFWWWPPQDWDYAQRYFSDWHCVMEWYAKFWGDYNDYYGSYRWQKLGQAATRFGIDTGGAHGAVIDALMTLGVVKGMAEARLSSEMTDNEDGEN